MTTAIKAERVAELRKLADDMNLFELQALCLLFGLRSMQHADLELIEAKEVSYVDVPNKHGCADRAVEYMNDMLCCDELIEVARQVDLGDYAVYLVNEPKFITKV